MTYGKYRNPSKLRGEKPEPAITILRPIAPAWNGHSAGWRSDDGRVEIYLDETFQTECEEPHPVRVRVDTTLLVIPAEAKRSYGRRGVEYASWHCYGGEEHYYSQWTVQIDGDWTDDVYDTFAQARGVVEKIVGKTKLGKRLPA